MAPTISKSGRRPKQYPWRLWVTFAPLERMLLSYYADSFNKDQTDIIRGMIRKYVKADQNFDPKKFVTYVQKELLANEEDEETREEIKAQLKEFKESWGNA